MAKNTSTLFQGLCAKISVIWCFASCSNRPTISFCPTVYKTGKIRSPTTASKLEESLIYTTISIPLTCDEKCQRTFFLFFCPRLLLNWVKICCLFSVQWVLKVGYCIASTFYSFSQEIVSDSLRFYEGVAPQTNGCL